MSVYSFTDFFLIVNSYFKNSTDAFHLKSYLYFKWMNTLSVLFVCFYIIISQKNVTVNTSRSPKWKILGVLYIWYIYVVNICFTWSVYIYVYVYARGWGGSCRVTLLYINIKNLFVLLLFYFFAPRSLFYLYLIGFMLFIYWYSQLIS